MAGDTVLLRGTFIGQQIAPGVSGNAAQPITFDSYNYPTETAVLDGGVDGGFGGRAVLLVSRNYIVIRRLTIQNVVGSWGHGVYISGSNDNVVDGNAICNVGNEAANFGDSIYLVDASRNRIVNNTVTNGGHSLIQVSSQQATISSSANVISGNTLSNPWTTPVILAGMSEGTIVEHNRISDGAINGVNFPRPGIQVSGSGHIIRRNEVFNNASSGILLNAFVFRDVGVVFPQDAIGNQIYHNVFYGNGFPFGPCCTTGEGSFGVFIVEKEDRTVRDNLIANNIFFRPRVAGLPIDSIVIDQYQSVAPWPVGSLNGNQIRNNIFLRQPGSAGEKTVLRIRTPAQVATSNTMAEFEQTYPEASNNLEADPLFTDEVNRVFTLQAGSPAIDRGMVIQGEAYLGAAPDIGAYERQ